MVRLLARAFRGRARCTYTPRAAVLAHLSLHTFSRSMFGNPIATFFLLIVCVPTRLIGVWLCCTACFSCETIYVRARNISRRFASHSTHRSKEVVASAASAGHALHA